MFILFGAIAAVAGLGWVLHEANGLADEARAAQPNIGANVNKLIVAGVILYALQNARGGNSYRRRR